MLKTKQNPAKKPFGIREQLISIVWWVMGLGLYWIFRANLWVGVPLLILVPTFSEWGWRRWRGQENKKSLHFSIETGILILNGLCVIQANSSLTFKRGR